MSNSFEDAALTGAITFYSVGCYERFMELTGDQAQEAMDFAQEQSMVYPLWQRNEKGEFPQYDVPHFGIRSSVWLMALMSAWLVWMQKGAGIELLPDSPLLKAAECGYTLLEAKVARCKDPGEGIRLMAAIRAAQQKEAAQREETGE